VDPSILLECLGASPGTIKDWAFEHVADEEEGTNFDFFILFASGHRVYIEVKFAESSFGTCVDDAQHRSKLDSI